jgi:hypothetical protein
MGERMREFLSNFLFNKSSKRNSMKPYIILSTILAITCINVQSQFVAFNDHYRVRIHILTQQITTYLEHPAERRATQDI